MLNSSDHPLWNGLLPELMPGDFKKWLIKMCRSQRPTLGIDSSLPSWDGHLHTASHSRPSGDECQSSPVSCSFHHSSTRVTDARCSARLYVGFGIGTQDSCLCDKHITHWAMSLAPQVVLAYFILNRFILNLWQYREANLITLGGYSLSWVCSVTHTSR